MATATVDTTQSSLSSPPKDDASLIKEADELFGLERLLNATELLEKVKDKSFRIVTT
jgi:hypothetical protein